VANRREHPSSFAHIVARPSTHREERPDVDAIYMRAVVSVTGRGGWKQSRACRCWPARIHSIVGLTRCCLPATGLPCKATLSEEPLEMFDSYRL
jgi:hypothetical protein